MTVSEISVVAFAIAFVYANKERRGLTFATATLLVGLSIAWQSGFLFFLGLTLFAFGCLEGRLLSSGRRRNAWLLSSSGIVFCVFAVPAMNRVRKVWNLRKQTPYVSLTQRVAPHPDAPVLVVDTTDAKRQEQQPAEFGFRASAIRAIHQTAVHHFLVAEDFGVGRMRYDPLWVAQDHGKLIEWDSGDNKRSVSYSSQYNVPGATVQPKSAEKISVETRTIPLSPETIEQFDAAHRSYENWFLDDSRLGDVRDVNSVAGFLSHAMTTPNTTPESQVKQAHAPLEYWDREQRAIRRDFTLRKLQLVGLLYHDKPVAYDLDTLPELINAETAPTRDLSKFENEALKRLVAGQSVHYRQSGETLQMMGALRSVESCRECHNGPPNQLLGAFSYELAIREPNRDDRVQQGSEALIAHSN